jgi:hypothetical protein
VNCLSAQAQQTQKRKRIAGRARSCLRQCDCHDSIAVDRFRTRHRDARRLNIAPTRSASFCATGLLDVPIVARRLLKKSITFCANVVRAGLFRTEVPTADLPTAAFSHRECGHIQSMV